MEKIPEDWVLRDCANCDQPVWVPDIREILAVCSSRCAVELMDKLEHVKIGRKHLETPECWCGPAVILLDAAEPRYRLEHQD